MSVEGLGSPGAEQEASLSTLSEAERKRFDELMDAEMKANEIDFAWKYEDATDAEREQWKAEARTNATPKILKRIVADRKPLGPM